MPRKCKYTAKGLERAVNRYFGSISRVVPRMEKRETGELDAYGHPETVLVQVVDGNGSPVFETDWLRPPSVAGLCEYLDIDKSTWAAYCDAKKHPAFSDTTSRARGRMEAWLVEQLLSREGKDVKGIVFNLAANYGYRDRQEPVSARQQEAPQEPAEAPAQTMTFTEKAALLEQLRQEALGDGQG